MEIIKLRLDQLKPYEKNAKRHTDEQIEHIINSIKRFQFCDPIGVWGEKNVIVEGHGRYFALKKMGVKEVDCIRLDHLSDEERKAYTLVHNQATLETPFDDDLLKIELDGIFDIDMSEFGFDLSLNDEEEPQEIEEDEVPEEVETRCKIGDLWILGSHRLICGDSTDPAVVDRLMDGVKADISITSPPYGASNSAKIRDHYVKGKDTKESFYEQHKDKIDEWGQLIQNAFDNMTTHSECQFINIQMLADNKREFVSFWQRNIDTFCDVIVWDKKSCTATNAIKCPKQSV